MNAGGVSRGGSAYLDRPLRTLAEALGAAPGRRVVHDELGGGSITGVSADGRHAAIAFDNGSRFIVHLFDLALAAPAPDPAPEVPPDAPPDAPPAPEPGR